MIESNESNQSARSVEPPALDRRHPYGDRDVGRTSLAPTYRVDLRPLAPDVFFDAEPVSDWKALKWEKIGRPYRVERWSAEKKRWEREQGQELPVKTSWEMLNRSFQRWFDADALAARQVALRNLPGALGRLDLGSAWDAVEEIAQFSVWNYVHRIDDAIWHPRGKRALFEGLDLRKPEILFLGAADGYEAMQLKIKLFYTLFADSMNFAYRELMDVTHLGLYAYENGFDILRHGRIKAHNGIVVRPR